MSDDKLKVQTKLPAFGLRKGIAANRYSYEQTIKNIDPLTVPNRLGLVIDDSGSMGHEGMENVHKGVKNFTASCNYQDTSIAVYPLNADRKPLTCDFDIVTMYVNGIEATGGTPIYSVLNDLGQAEKITRAILFSDGSPTDSHVINKEEGYSWGDDGSLAKKVVALFTEKHIPIDTIFIGLEPNAKKEMEELARLTGGTFVHFQDTLQLSTSLKYLAPKFRAMLANPEIKARIERGEQI